MIAQLPHVVIHTDGACSGNPGPGGWGAILAFGDREKELKGGEALTTNNRMELMAAISALEALKRPCSVDLHTDSQYLRNGVMSWIGTWKRNGWRTADKKPVKNVDLWQRRWRRTRCVGIGCGATPVTSRTSAPTPWRARRLPKSAMPAAPSFKAASAAAFPFRSGVRHAGRFRLTGGCSGTTGRGVTSLPTNQHRVRFMIESLMLLGIGVCAGCLLVLAFIPLVHRRATRITTRHMDDATPLAINAIQADKDRLRAEFATSVRRLEVGVEEAAGHLGEIGRQKMEIQRLRLELDKKMALVFALRYRDKVRKSIVRRLAKLVFYAFIRSERRTRRELFGMVQARSLAHARRAHMAGSQT